MDSLATQVSDMALSLGHVNHARFPKPTSRVDECIGGLFTYTDSPTGPLATHLRLGDCSSSPSARSDSAKRVVRLAILSWACPVAFPAKPCHTPLGNQMEGAERDL